MFASPYKITVFLFIVPFPPYLSYTLYRRSDNPRQNYLGQIPAPPGSMLISAKVTHCFKSAQHWIGGGGGELFGFQCDFVPTILARIVALVRTYKHPMLLLYKMFLKVKCIIDRSDIQSKKKDDYVSFRSFTCKNLCFLQPNFPDY